MSRTAARTKIPTEQLQELFGGITIPQQTVFMVALSSLYSENSQNLESDTWTQFLVNRNNNIESYDSLISAQNSLRDNNNS